MKYRIHYFFLTALLLFSLKVAAQPVKKIQTFYQKYDTTGLSIPLKEEYYVLENDTIKQGPYKKFSAEGHLLLSGAYHQGQKDSVFTEYYEGEIPKSEVTYENDQKTGEAFFYSIKGELLFKEIYGSAKNPHLYQKLDKENKIVAEGYLKNGLLDSIITEYYPNGAIQTQSTYRKGLKEGTSFIYNKEGKLIQKAEYISGNLAGEITTYYPSGNIKNQATYKNGGLDGVLKEYYSNNTLKSESLYRNNLQNGLTKTFYEDGKPRTEEHYLNGELNGGFRTFYPEGGINSESYIVDGKKNGVYKNYNKKGILTLDVSYRDGVLEGENKAYFDDGKAKHKFNYKGGKKVGKNIAYFPNGEIALEEIYKEEENGISLKARSFYESGNLQQTYGFIQPRGDAKRSTEENIKTGEWLSYYDNKKLKIKEFFQNDRLHGERLLYNEDGSLSEKQQYTNGIKKGIWYTYYPDGKTKSETTYQNSTLYGPYKTYHSNGKPEIVGHYINNRKNKHWLFYNEEGKHVKTQTYHNDQLTKEKIIK